MPEGESGVRKGNLTQDRQEALAEYWGSPEKERLERWGDPMALGKLLGLSAATVRKAKFDKRVKSLISEALNNQLLYDVIEARRIAMQIIRDDHAKPETRLKGWSTLERMNGTLATGGISINQSIITPMSDDIPDEVLITRMEEISRRRVPPRVED